MHFLQTEPGLDLTPAQWTAFQQYADLLHTWNQRFNLTAVRDPEVEVGAGFGERGTDLAEAGVVVVLHDENPCLALTFQICQSRSCCLRRLRKMLTVSEPAVEISVVLDRTAVGSPPFVDPDGAPTRSTQAYKSLGSHLQNSPRHS